MQQEHDELTQLDEDSSNADALDEWQPDEIDSYLLLGREDLDKELQSFQLLQAKDRLDTPHWFV